jgi:cytochrome c551
MMSKAIYLILPISFECYPVVDRHNKIGNNRTEFGKGTFVRRMLMFKKGLVTLLGAMLVFSLAGCGGSKNNGNTTPSSPAAPAASSQAAGSVNAEAETTYRTNCITCHATDLRGGVGPNLQHVGGQLTADEIHNRIANGGGGMPAFKGTLTEDQINALTAWLAAKS